MALIAAKEIENEFADFSSSDNILDAFTCPKRARQKKKTFFTHIARIVYRKFHSIAFYNNARSRVILSFFIALYSFLYFICYTEYVYVYKPNFDQYYNNRGGEQICGKDKISYALHHYWVIVFG